MKELYTINEFCELFRITRPTFYQWQKIGYIKTIKVGKRTRIHSDEVERLKKGG